MGAQRALAHLGHNALEQEEKTLLSFPYLLRTSTLQKQRCTP